MGQRRLDVIVSGKNGALLRAAAPLESEQCGHIAAGQRCMVVDAATLDDGRERLLVRHATATGWCSAKVVRSVAGETVREDVDETRAAWLANAAVLRDMVRGMAARGPRAWSEGMEKALMAPLVVSEDDDVLIRRTKQTNYWALAKEIYGTLARVAVGNLEAKLLRDALAKLQALCVAECAPQESWLAELGGELGFGDAEANTIDRALAASGFPKRDTSTPVAFELQRTEVPLLLKYLCLPFAVYVRNSTHLYSVLRKFHGLRLKRYGDAQTMERDFEAGAQKSAWLVFSLFAALQFVRRARAAHGPAVVEPLASTAPMVAVGVPGSVVVRPSAFF